MVEALSAAAWWVGYAVVVTTVCYLFGPFLMRWIGVALGVGAVAGLLFGRFEALAFLVVGVGLWLLGHRGVAARDSLWRSPLAARFWARFAGGRFDPTRGRSVPIYMRR